MRYDAAFKSAIIAILKAAALAAPNAPIHALMPRGTGEDGILVGRQQPGSNIEAIVSAAKSILSAAYPDGAIPTDINVRTIAWQSSVINTATYTAQATGVPSASKSLSQWQTPSPTTTISTRSETSSRSSSSRTTSTSATETPTAPASDQTTDDSHNGDRAVAIALGVLFIVPAVVLAAAVLLLLWRRKRKTGHLFKAARCSECLTTPRSSAIDTMRSVSPEMQQQNEPTADWFALGTHWPRSPLADSGERRPEPVQGTYHTRQFSRQPDEIFSQAPTRLQKNNSCASRAVPGLVDAAGPLRPHEVLDNDLTGVAQLDHDEPARRAAEIGRLSAIPLIAHQMKELEMEFQNLCSSDEASSSEDASKQPTEMDAESPSRGTSSLWHFGPNPFVVAQLVEADGGHGGLARNVSDGSYRPSELDGGSVSPGSRRISSLMPFAHTMDATQLNGEGQEDTDNITRPTSDATSSHSWAPRNGQDQLLVPHPGPAELQAIPPASKALLLSDSRSSSPASGETSSADSDVPPILDSAGLRRTELTLPERMSSISSPDTSPMCERDQLLARFGTPKVSPVTPAATNDQFLPATGYTSSPLSKKRRPNAMSLRSTSSLLSNASSDMTSATTSRVPPGVRDGGPAAAYGSSPLWKKKRPLPISSGTLPPLPAVQDVGAAEDEVESVHNSSRRSSIHPDILVPGRKSMSEPASTDPLKRDSQHPLILLPATTYHPPGDVRRSSQTLRRESHHVRHGLPTPPSFRSEESLQIYYERPSAQSPCPEIKERPAPDDGRSFVSEWSEFTFTDNVSGSQSNGESGEDDGYKSAGERGSVVGRYELMS